MNKRNMIYASISVIVFLIFIFLLVSPSENEKYCDLSKVIDKDTIKLHTAFYEMEEIALEEVGGDRVISGQIIGKLMGGSKSSFSREYINYVCWYDFTVLNGDIIETITVQHIFVLDKVLEGDNLIEWRKLPWEREK